MLSGFNPALAVAGTVCIVIEYRIPHGYYKYTQGDSQSVGKINIVNVQKRPTRFSKFRGPVLHSFSFPCLE